jgi:tetratricopeptide (TPR) repeat protein
VVAIACETKKEEVRLRADFVDALRERIIRTNRKHFDVYELSPYHTAKCQSDEGASRYLRATQAHLIIFGRCRVRTLKGKPTYVVDFRKGVRHSTIPIEVSQELRRDMHLAFPARMLIPEQNELEGFEATRDIFEIASKFTLGIASLLSGDPLTAFDLHHSAYQDACNKIGVDDNSPMALRQYKARLVKYVVLSGLHATKVYYKSKPTGCLEKMAEYLNAVQEVDPANYDAHLIRAICIFLQKKDLESARQELKKARNERNAAWQYSEAFLFAYEGKLEEAHRIYKRAFKGIVHDETPLDVEEFIVDVLTREQDKIQFWYCLGLINYFLKSDFEAARRDLSKFVEAASNQGLYASSVSYAKTYLEEIEGKIHGGGK